MSCLSNQDKLALMMTAVGSQRKLAEFIGISHQKLGRWLKEGQEGGVKKIPSDPFTTEGINAVFDAYKSATKEHAKAVNAPYDGKLPIWVKRPFLSRPDRKTGEFIRGDRLLIENTHFLSKELRHSVFTVLHGTKRMNAVSVRSTINLYQYNRYAEGDNKRRTAIQEEYRRSLIEEELEEELEGRTQGQIDKEIKRKLKHLVPHVQIKPIYTKMEDIRAFTDIELVLKNVDRKLRQKHEPATGEHGTRLADAYLFQLKPTPKPANSNEPQRKESAKPSAEKLSRRRKRTMGGRGPK